MKGDKFRLDVTSSDGTEEEKYRDRGSSASGRYKIICEETDGPASHVSSLSTSEETQQPEKLKILRATDSPRRPISFSPSEAGSTVADKRASLYSSGGSEASVPQSPFKRRHAGGTAGGHSGERPRVS